MIAERLIGLNHQSIYYGRVMDIYARAYSFFRSSLKDSARPEGVFDLVGPVYELIQSSGEGYQNGLNREPQKKIRKLRDTMKREIIKYIAFLDDPFQPTPDNLRALQIGGTAASHYLQTLRHGVQLRTQELFDSAVELLERHNNRTARLTTDEIQYLMIGVALLLSSLLIELPMDIGAQSVIRLLRIAGQAENGQKQFRRECLRLLLTVYTIYIFRYDYPDWTQPPSLSLTSRAERAIEVIAYCTRRPWRITMVSPFMVNLALLELLSNPVEYKLDDTDITTTSEAFILIVGDPSRSPGSYIFPQYFPHDSFSSSVKNMNKLISSEPDGPLSKDTVTIACLIVLNRTKMNQSAKDPPLGDAYAFVIERMLNLRSTGRNATGQTAALDLMGKFHDPNHYQRTQNLIPNLAQSLEKRNIFPKFKQETEREGTKNDPGFAIKLFATGQAWLLIGFAINGKSGTTDHEDWRKCISSFVGNENLWDSPELAIREIKEQRSALAEQYKAMWDDNSNHHAYFGLLYLWMMTAGIDSPLNGTHMSPSPSVHPLRVPSTALATRAREVRTEAPVIEASQPIIQSDRTQDYKYKTSSLSATAAKEVNTKLDEHMPMT
ncbi:Pc22g05210 [Rhizoctonia solani]|uniref:Pc22g05210 n=1 Tax=Rhizoctonia solani TaxID=456999 RepID=A0A0K6GBB6_9AGAM|nr:Pc22g05210 [Rhizoctonia solani]